MKAFKSYCLIKNDSCSSLSKPTYFLQLNHGKNLKVNNFNKQNLLYKLNPNSKQHQLLHQYRYGDRRIEFYCHPCLTTGTHLSQGLTYHCRSSG